MSVQSPILLGSAAVVPPTPEGQRTGLVLPGSIDSSSRPNSAGSAVLGNPQLRGSMLEEVVRSDFTCQRSNHSIGVQEGSPVGWSADGKLMGYVTGDYTVMLARLNEANGMFEIENALMGSGSPIASIVVHPKLPVVVTAGTDGLRVWSTENGRQLQEIGTSLEANTESDAHDGPIEVALWADERLLITGGQDTAIKIWQITADSTLAHLETITGHKATILTLSFVCTPEGVCRLASAGREDDNTIKIWDCSSLVEGAAFDKRTDDASVCCSLLKNLEGHRGDVVSTAWSSTARTLISGARDNSMNVYDIESGQALRSIVGHKGDVNSLRLINKDAYLLSGSADGTVKLWKLVPEAVVEVADVQTDEAALKGLLTESAAVAAFSKDKDSMEVNLDASHEGEGVSTMALAGYHMATTSTAHGLRLWDMRNVAAPTMVQEFVGFSHAAKSVQYLSGGSLIAAGSASDKIYVFDRATSRPVSTFDFGGSVEALASTVDNSLLMAAGSAYSIKGYSLARGQAELNSKPVVEFVGHNGKISVLAINQSGSIMASAGHDFDMNLWRLDANAYTNPDSAVQVRPKLTRECHSSHITAMAFSQGLDGDYLATGGADHSLMVWKVRDGIKCNKHWECYDAHEHVVSSVCWGKVQSAKLLMSGSWDFSVKVWDVDGGGRACERTLRGHTGLVSGLEVTDNGSALLSSAWDCTVRMWSLEGQMHCLCQYLLPGQCPLNSISCSGTEFVVGAHDGMLHCMPTCDEPGRRSLGAQADDAFESPEVARE